MPGVKPSPELRGRRLSLLGERREAGPPTARSVFVCDEMIHLVMHHEEQDRQFQFNCDQGPC